MRRLVLTMLCTAILAAPLAAQVFPDDEMLDVVRITDGSVLRGKIIENFVDRYVEIEIYGGSIFTVAYENIESISEVRNPDYQTQWLRVELDPAGLAEGDTEPGSVDDAGIRDYLGNGGFLAFNVGYSSVDYDGDDWEDTLSEVNAEDENGDNISFGFSYGYFRRARPDEDSWGLWGVRTGLEMGSKDVSADLDLSGQDVTSETGRYEFRADVLEIPFELLFGGGGEQMFWYLGGGLGGSLLLGTPDSEYEDEDVGHPSGNDPSSPFHAFIRGTTGIYVRLGRSSWVGEFRLTYDRIVSGSWYGDYDQYYHSFTGNAGLGYRF